MPFRLHFDVGKNDCQIYSEIEDAAQSPNQLAIYIKEEAYTDEYIYNCSETAN